MNYGIIERHGGELTIESAEGRGTTVTFRLPATVTPEDVAPAQTEVRRPRSLQVLVIDDEQEVRGVVADMLIADGHRVIEAAGGPEGLVRLGEESRIELAITDLGMPGMSGWEVAPRAIKTSHPSVIVGLLTGWSDGTRGPGQASELADFVLAKTRFVDRPAEGDHAGLLGAGPPVPARRGVAPSCFKPICRRLACLEARCPSLGPKVTASTRAVSNVQRPSSRPRIRVTKRSPYVSLATSVLIRSRTSAARPAFSAAFMVFA